MKDQDKKPGIFRQFMDLTSATLDAKLFKARTDFQTDIDAKKKATDEEEETFYAKSLLEDPSYAIHSQGWKEKPHRLQNAHLKQMSLKSSIISAIILTRQNQMSIYSKHNPKGQSKGWRIVIKDERRLVEELKESMRKGGGKDLQKADPNKTKNDDKETFDWELERRARRQLKEEHAAGLHIVQQFISNGGMLEDRPFESRRWGFDSILRALVRDTLTYDLYACELVRTNAGDLHRFSPVDASTIKYASPMLKFSPKGGVISDIDLNILYPEKEAAQIEQSRVLEIDQQKAEDGEYRYVQVVRGRVERAFTDDEMKVGIRNPATDIYNNGYGIAELELIVSLVTGHLNAEFYNQSYFTQGFSAKGILHIKSEINRRKLETVRQQWNHMLKGTRNSFQTPIFAGMEEVSWIPLVQNHDDIGFESWLRYLTKMICSVYQIDPQELGIGFKEEGGKGGGLSGDNTDSKLTNSQERGLFPLIRHFQAYFNNHIIPQVDSRFELEFTGVTTETEEERIKRYEKLAGFVMDVNEVRDAFDLVSIPNADGVIMNTEYMKWFFAEKLGLVPAGSVDPTQAEAVEGASKPNAPIEVKKSERIKVEYFQRSK